MLNGIAKATSRVMQALIPSGASMYSSADMPSTAPWADYWYQAVGLPGASGIMGGDEAYEFVSICYAATNFLTGIGSTIPINLTKTEKKDSGTVANIVSDDSRHLLLNDEANPDQTAMAARAMACPWQINRGTAFFQIQREEFRRRGELGKPLHLWPIYPTRCKSFRSEEDGTLWWSVRNKDGSDTHIPDTNMFRVPNTMMSRDGLTGIGVADRAFQQITLGQSLDRTENDASMSGVPRIVVEAPQKMNLPEQQAFRQQWRELYTQGGEGVALLVGGMQAKPLSWSATDSDFVNRRKQHQSTCASLYNVPALLLQLMDDPQADPAKILQMFQKCGLKWLTAWVQEANRKLLTKTERLDGYGWKIDYHSLLEADPAGRADYYSRLFPLGVFSPNDILQAEGKNPYPEGNKRFVQGAMRPIDEPYNATSPQNPPQDPKSGKADPLRLPNPGKPKASAMQLSTVKAGARLMLEDCIRRLTHKEASAACKASKNSGEWQAWMDSFYADHEPWAASELEKPLAVTGAFGFIADAKGYAAILVKESKQALLDVSDGPPSQFCERVEELTEQWKRERASAIVARIAELN